MKLIPQKNQNQSRQEGGLMPLRDAMNRLFDESLWNPFGLISRDLGFESLPSFNQQFFTPSTDISETDKEFLIEADVPGFSANDLNLELNGSTLILKGKKESEKEETNKSYHLKERSYSNWERSFNLPYNSNLEKIECDLKDGKLTISVPKNTNGQSKKLLIKSN